MEDPEEPTPDTRSEPVSSPGAGPEAGELTAAILQAARLHRQVSGQALRTVGLHPGQETVMMQLWEHGPQRQTDLVRRVGSDPAAMTRTVGRLEHGGFVRRTPSPTDRRAMVVEATAAGAAARQEVLRLWAEVADRAVAGLDAAERATALALLSRIVDNLTRAGGPAAPEA